jgi:pilus assembly protein Flp/PilA
MHNLLLDNKFSRSNKRIANDLTRIWNGLVESAGWSKADQPLASQLLGRFVMRNLVKFFKDDSGASAAEYAVLLTLVTVVLIGAVTSLGNAIKAVFDQVSTTLTNAA